MNDKLSKADMELAKAKYPISKWVEKLSLDGDQRNDSVFVPEIPGQHQAALSGVAPGNAGTHPGNSLSNERATDIRSSRAERGRANLLADLPREIAKLERYAKRPLASHPQVQTGLGKVFYVRVESVRERLLDEDNLCEKFIVDLLRYAGVIPNDNPSQTHVEVRQRKTDPGEGEKITVEVRQV